MTAKKKVNKNDYSRFYALLRQNPLADKEELVSQFTNGRTIRVSEMRKYEYKAMCDFLQYGSEQEQWARNKALKRARSSALLRIGRLGINTIDNWDGINAFCLSPRIAGKEFGKLSIEELEQLVKKLEIIIKKGGLKTLEVEDEEQVVEVPRLYVRMAKPRYLS